MKAVLLAGGTGSRLAPCTRGANKHLLPVHDQPMIYYPLALLMRAGIREIGLVVRPEDADAFRSLFGDGRQLGIQLSYIPQKQPLGIADAVARAKTFVDGQRFCVILGDSLFLGPDVHVQLRGAMEGDAHAVVFACHTDSPEDFAVLELGAEGQVLALKEKPARPVSSLVVPGLYVYDAGAFDVISSMPPSPRGELEITSLNAWYLEAGRLSVEPLGGGVQWLDLGTFDRLERAAMLVRSVEARSGIKPGCPERVAWEKGWIDDAALRTLGARMGASPYGAYLSALPQQAR